MKRFGLFLLVLAQVPAFGEFLDPLDVAARRVATAGREPMTAVAFDGRSAMAAGMRGVVVESSDNGKTWQQKPSPVQSDLTDIRFSTANIGWASGHDGVILKSVDHGRTWIKQLDGRAAAKSFATYYQRAIDGGAAADKGYLQQIALNFKDGPSLPYLEICPVDERTAYAVGPFGMIAATTDGGATWNPWLDQIDNPDFVTLNAIRKIGDSIYITGERGLVFKLAPGARRFARIETGYAGTFFGIVGRATTVIAFGLQGNVYRSPDGGSHWQAVALSSKASITAGVVLGQRGVALGTAAGELFLSRDDGRSFQQDRSGLNAPITALAASEGGLIYASPAGLSVVAGKYNDVR